MSKLYEYEIISRHPRFSKNSTKRIVAISVSDAKHKFTLSRPDEKIISCVKIGEIDDNGSPLAGALLGAVAGIGVGLAVKWLKDRQGGDFSYQSPKPAPRTQIEESSLIENTSTHIYDVSFPESTNAKNEDDFDTEQKTIPWWKKVYHAFLGICLIYWVCRGLYWLFTVIF
ncbi:hypothetical protein EDC51_10965 [Bibersteinia trehalosi]|uniref:hypothetical protein n=1 Tax=Bibersteinia trehalosi TaxID=47735 RepID=UPI00104742CB|nr:hypothetical protein [Bibersteinia trehalosi]TCT14177.1 hypothetical protein EDC51_10965 [Bibersteinia trehalosi]